MGSEVDAGGSGSSSADSDDDAGGAPEEPPELVRAREALAQYGPLDGEEEPLDLTHTRAALAAAGRLRSADGGAANAAGDDAPRLAPWPRGEDPAERADLEALGRAAWGAASAADAEAFAAQDDDADLPPLPPSALGGLRPVEPPRAQQQRRVLIEEIGPAGATSDVARPASPPPAPARPLASRVLIEEVEAPAVAEPVQASVLPATRMRIQEVPDDIGDPGSMPQLVMAPATTPGGRRVIAIEESDSDSDDEADGENVDAPGDSMADID